MSNIVLVQPVFESLTELWYKALSTIVIAGDEIKSRDGKCKEILGNQFILTNVYRNFITDPIRKMSPFYAAAELLWYLSGHDKIEMISYYAPQYKRFSDDGIKTWGAYGKRWQRYNQLDNLIDLLRRHPDTRQAIMTCWNTMDLGYAHEKKDIPCTISLQFLIRNSTLYCICTMRSNDIWLGLPYDIWSFTCLQILIAEELGLKVGTYTHQPGSLHLYERNYKKAGEILKNQEEDTIEFDWKNLRTWSLEKQIEQALWEENEGRNGKKWKPDRHFKHTLLGQLSIWCGFKTWGIEYCWPGFVDNDAMREYITNVILKK